MTSELSADVVVIGSGAAGLSAAVSAAVALGERREGGSVLLLERSDRLGGTTAVSGGVAWLPNNDHMRELELPDSPERALDYLRAISLGRADPALLEAFVAAAPEAARFLEAQTPLRFSAAGRGNAAGGVLPFPDYQADLPGGAANGRSLDPAPFDPSALGDLAEAMREPLPYSVSWSGGGLVLDSGEWVGGRGLVGALIAGALAHGVRIERGVRARRLLTDAEGRVAGLEADRDRETLRIEARRGVVLAAGGFEWDAELRREWLRGPVDALLSPQGLAEGDALRMAMERGAALANLGEAWWTLAVRLTGEGASADDAQGELRFLSGPRSLPGSILVNRLGRRFVNEAVNYHDIVRAFHVFDPGAFTYPNRPAWFLFGESYRRAYGLLSAAPGDPDPPWLVPSPSLEALAARCGIDAAGLRGAVARFDEQAARGVDPDFGRGEGSYDLATGDPSREGRARTLGPIGGPPYYALEVHVAVLGTSSGLRVDTEGRVLDVRGEPIAGLHAAGNTIAAPTGPGYGGGGGTIGPALTFGYLAGRTAARGD